MILCEVQRCFGVSRVTPEPFCARRKGVWVAPGPPPCHSVQGAKGFWRRQCPSRAILCEAQSGFGDSRAPQVHSVRGAKGSRRFQGPSNVILCKARRGLSDSRGPPEPLCARRRGVLTTAAPRWADVCGMLWVFMLWVFDSFFRKSALLNPKP